MASRVVEKTGRPALVIATEGDEAHGSGRSVPALHLLDALESCRELFTRFGGHSHAVGFALPSARVPELKQRMNDFVRERLMPEDLVPELRIDAELPLTSIRPDLLQRIASLEPFGQGNPEPVFSACGVNLLVPPHELKEKHVKFRVNQRQADGRKSFNYEAMGWRMAQRVKEEGLQPGDRMDLAFTLTMNDHPEFGGLELALEDFRKTTAATAAN